MNSASLIILSISLALGSVSWAQKETTCVHDATTFRCVKVLKNYDGDTLTVEIPEVHPLIGNKVSVRVFGIDTPEIKTKDQCEKEAGRMAKNLVSNLVKSAKRVDLLNVKRDKYFRILADVHLDGKSLSETLIKNNLALAYNGGTKSKTNWCQQIRMPAKAK